MWKNFLVSFFNASDCRGTFNKTKSFSFNWILDRPFWVFACLSKLLGKFSLSSKILVSSVKYFVSGNWMIFFISLAGSTLKWSSWGEKLVLECVVQLRKNSISLMWRAHFVCWSEQRILNIRPSSRITRSTGLLFEWRMDENTTSIPTSRNLSLHRGEVNWVPCSARTRAGLPISGM